MVGILDEHEARAQIRAYLDDRAWWILPLVSESAQAFAAQIEERFYSGPANADFTILMSSLGGTMFAIAFARKSRLPATKLAALLRTYSKQPLDAAALETQDVLIPATPAEQQQAVGALLLFNAWLYAEGDRADY